MLHLWEQSRPLLYLCCSQHSCKHRVIQKLGLLLRAHSSPVMSMQELESGVEASRVGVRALANHRAAVASEAAAAEAQAAIAERRIPELEADKKTAAAARV